MIFFNRYKKLLDHIKSAQEDEKILHLPNGVVLNFVPGHEYDGCVQSMIPRDDIDNKFVDKYIGKLNQVIEITVYDAFKGDVRILAVGTDRIFVEIIDVCTCYDTQRPFVPGTKYWIEDWLIE